MRVILHTLQQFNCIQWTKFLLIVCCTLIVFGCGGSSTSPVAVVAEDAENKPVIAQKGTFLDESYNLVTLGGDETLGLQAYWPSNSNMPASLQEKLHLILPQINKLFIEQNFTFSSGTEAAINPYYKKIFFKENSTAEEDHEGLSVTFSEDGSFGVLVDITNQLAISELSSQLTQFIYQSERYKYQQSNDILERLVTRGLALHFLQSVLPENEFLFPIHIEQAELLLALSQVSEGGESAKVIDNWFTGKALSEQATANAVGYYLAAQHFSFYSGSNATNSFSVGSELFLPWLSSQDNSIKKAQQYVRTDDVPDQVAVSELSRQANLFLGHYFIEGLNHEKLIALSFDDGPSQYTSKILDVLEQAKVPASFFWQGQHLAQYPDVIKRSIAAGHTVANHSWDHTNGMRYSADDLWENQVIKTNDEFQLLFQITPRFYRPPYGEISDEQIELLADKGMKVLLWSVDSRDWNPELNSVAQIEKELINNQHEEVITLMHDAGGNRQNTVDALPAIIEHYKAQGYRFVNLETLLGISDKH